MILVKSLDKPGEKPYFTFPNYKGMLMLNIDSLATIAHCPLFKNISPEQIKLLLDKNQYQLRHYTKNEMIAGRTEECKALTIVTSGSVKAEMLDISGKVIKIEDVAAPLPYAVAFLFGQNNFYPVDVIANEKTTVLYIPKSSVIQMMQIDQQFLKNYLDLISTKSQFLSDKIWFISFKTIRQKIIHYFLEITENGTKTVKLTKTQQELSDFFGVTRPSLARVISELVDQELISIDKKELTIKDLLQLISEIE